MAMSNPAAVVISASEMPEATIAGEVALAAAMESKARIIPKTVPVNPIKVDTAAMVARAGR